MALDAPEKSGKGWLNKRAIILLFIANSISGVAQGMTMFAIPWFLAKEGGGTAFGYLYAAITLVSLAWGPYSGTLVDKHDRKKVFLVLNLVMGILLCLVAAFGFSNGGVPWAMVGFVFMATFMNYNLHYPNLYAFSQEITEPEHHQKITSYLEIQGQVASVLAGAGAALLMEGTINGHSTIFGFRLDLGFDIKAWSIQKVFLVDGMTYFASFLIIWFIRYKSLAERSNESGSILSRLKTGLDFLRGNRPIFVFGIASYAIFICVLVAAFYINPIYVDKHLNESIAVFASSEMYYGIGAILAGIVIRYVFNEKRIGIPASIIIMTFATAVLFAVLNVTTSNFVFYLMLFILGLTNAGTRIQRVTFLFRNVPNQYYGRAGSIFFVANILFRIFFIGIFSLSFFQTDNNVIHTMGIMAVFLVINGFVLMGVNGKLAKA